MNADSLTADNLIAILSDPEQRRILQNALDKEQGSYLPLINRYCEIAPACAATADELHGIVKELLKYRHRYDDLLCELVFHPEMSERTLMLLFAKHRCLSNLAHRSVPQRLLEMIAGKYRTSEAITTLALRYYSKPNYPIEAFAAFVQEHSGDYMLRFNLVRANDLPPDKKAFVETIFAEHIQKWRENQESKRQMLRL